MKALCWHFEGSFLLYNLINKIVVCERRDCVMDKRNEKAAENLMDNVLTMVGAACIIYPLIRQATETLIPEMQKLTSGETLETINSLPPSHEEISEREEKPEHDAEHQSREEEIAELKRKLARYEGGSEEYGPIH